MNFSLFCRKLSPFDIIFCKLKYWIKGTLIHRVTVLRISLMKMHMINDNVAKNCIICGFCRSGIWSTTLSWNDFWRSIHSPCTLKNQVQWTGFLTCKNQFQNWFLQSTQAVKIQFEIDLKSSSIELDFSNWIFQKVQMDRALSSVQIGK